MKSFAYRRPRSRLLFQSSLAAVFLMALGQNAAFAAQRTDINTVAISGLEPYLGAISGLNSSGPTLSSNGTVVFMGELSSGDTAILASDNPKFVDVISEIGRNGDVFAVSSTSVAVNAHGYIAFAGYLYPGGDVNSTDDEGIWAGFEGDFLIASEGSFLGYPFGRLGSFTGTFTTQVPVYNDNDSVAFQSNLQDDTGAPISGAIDWISDGGGLQAIAGTGLRVFGTPLGTEMTSLGTPGLTAYRDVYYSGTYHVPGSNGPDGSGIWDLGLAIALTGQVAPGTPANTFVDVSYRATSDGTNVHANQVGETIFFGTITGAGATPGANDHGVWIGGAASALVARQGDAAPGLPAGTTFSTFLDTGIANGMVAGVLATVAGPGITSANSTGIWVGPAGSLQLVLRDGETIADGANAPLTISGLNHFTMNDFGQIVAQLSDGSLVGTNRAGQLTIVARLGDQFEVALGDFRIISAITQLAGGETVGGPTAFNDLGVVAFAATFTDGTSGVFYSDALAVPEPGTCALAATGLLLLVGLRRQVRGGVRKKPVQCGRTEESAP